MAVLKPITPPGASGSSRDARYANTRAEYDFSGAKRGALLSSQGKTRVTIISTMLYRTNFVLARSRLERVTRR